MADVSSPAPAYLSRYDALLAVSKTLAGHRTMRELFAVLADHLHSVVPFDYLALVLHDPLTEEMRLVVVEPPDIVVPFVSKPVAEGGPAVSVWETQKRAAIAIPEDGPLPETLAFIRSQGWRMACWLPLTTAHRRVGILAFGRSSATPYTDDVIALMEQVAAVVAIAVDNGINFDEAHRFQRELREERDGLRFLLDVNNLLVSHLDYHALLKAIHEAVQRLVKADHISIALYDEPSSTLRLHWTYDATNGFTRSDVILPLDRSAAGVVFQRGEVGVFGRSDLDGRGPDSAPVMKAAGLESVCCVPLVTQRGKVGTLNVGSRAAHAFSSPDRDRCRQCTPVRRDRPPQRAAAS